MNKRWGWLAAGLAALTAVGLVVASVYDRKEVASSGATAGEKLAALRIERAGLQARADGSARLELLGPLRVASLLSDALAVRGEAGNERNLDRLPTAQRRAIEDIEALNVALRDAFGRPGAGATLAARAAARRAQAALEQLAGSDDLPLVLSFTPRFVAPRRATGDLTLVPRAAAPPAEGAVRLEPAPRRTEDPAQPTVPRYAPAFAAAREDDPPVAVEIVGLRLAPDGPPPVLTVGAWRGVATLAPERLRFSVPRSAFATDAGRTVLVNGTLSLRRDTHTLAFELPFVVLPDRPGSIALDQKVRAMVPESNTLVSPEILARAGVGETRTVRRCFDPPEGWSFDKEKRRVVIVERLAWVDDISDPTMNSGTVEFATDEGPRQSCVIVTARPASKSARTATIGRFEATLVRERPQDRVAHSGVRALDWREPTRVAIEPGAVAWKLYVRLFDEIDREFEGTAAAEVPFLHITLDPDGKALLLSADPSAEP